AADRGEVERAAAAARIKNRAAAASRAIEIALPSLSRSATVRPIRRREPSGKVRYVPRNCARLDFDGSKGRLKIPDPSVPANSGGHAGMLPTILLSERSSSR